MAVPTCRALAVDKQRSTLDAANMSTNNSEMCQGCLPTEEPAQVEEESQRFVGRRVRSYSLGRHRHSCRPRRRCRRRHFLLCTLANTECSWALLEVARFLEEAWKAQSTLPVEPVTRPEATEWGCNQAELQVQVLEAESESFHRRLRVRYQLDRYYSAKSTPHIDSIRRSNQSDPVAGTFHSPRRSTSLGSNAARSQHPIPGS